MVIHESQQITMLVCDRCGGQGISTVGHVTAEDMILRNEPFMEGMRSELPGLDGNWLCRLCREHRAKQAVSMREVIAG